ncbi:MULTISPECIES: glutathione peroxidase [unclassified Roseovarius]|uniref:glutathione peroxidase n=1 Tax=unclassified Roseovarius TaxID=2614913 RepID=UPI00273F8D31|nr:glutathione peroxidase [Roseovarius sp. MMSF_3350]
MMRFLFGLLATVFALPALALDLQSTFTNIDGGTHRLADWQGQPVLVVNTASMCGFTGQYSDLQTLYDTYRDRGLVVLAVPSDDFNQELASEDEVKDFCEVNYDLTLPMTGITNVRGAAAHPFYRSVAEEAGFTPAWNFNKILLSPEGEVVATYGSPVKPMSSTITGEIEKLLARKGG